MGKSTVYLLFVILSALILTMDCASVMNNTNIEDRNSLLRAFCNIFDFEASRQCMDACRIIGAEGFCNIFKNCQCTFSVGFLGTSCIGLEALKQCKAACRMIGKAGFCKISKSCQCV